LLRCSGIVEIICVNGYIVHLNIFNRFFPKRLSRSWFRRRMAAERIERLEERHWTMRQLAKLYLHQLTKALTLMLKTARHAQEGSDRIRKCIGNLARRVISRGGALFAGAFPLPEVLGRRSSHGKDLTPASFCLSRLGGGAWPSWRGGPGLHPYWSLVKGVIQK
jgi:hypothetical protein